MTNEEAAKILRRIQEPEAWEPQINGAAFEALDMAIEALGRQQAAGSKDLISRQSLLAKYDEQHEGPPGRARKLIEDEPPALGTNLAEVGTDAISRQAAIDDIWTVSPLARLDRKWVDRWLRQLPPIQPKLLQPWEVLVAQAVLPQPKRGSWHYSNGKPATIGRSFGVICDQCGKESEYCTNFCGECGADMRGVQDGTG